MLAKEGISSLGRGKLPVELQWLSILACLFAYADADYCGKPDLWR